MLMSSVKETDDLNLPLMVWYAVEPLVAAQPEAAVLWLDSTKLPLVREFIARRLTPLPATGRDDARFRGRPADRLVGTSHGRGPTG